MAGGKNKFWSAFFVLLFLASVGGLFIVSISYLFFPGEDLLESALSNDKIALVKIEGVILDSDNIIRQIRRWADDDDIKAIVLRINSPGGAVAPSQEIFSEVRKALKQKPVITSMGAIAASGGYYIAAASQMIIANPGTLTGSIGVIMTFANMQKLMDKIGMKSIVLKSGKFKDIGSPYRPLTDDERELLQGVITSIYTQFIEDVAQGRKMDIEDVRKLADGRIYTGVQAKELNLIDKLGNLQDSIETAARIANISAKPVVVEDQQGSGFLRWLVGEEFDLKIPGMAGLSSGIYYLWPAW